MEINVPQLSVEHQSAPEAVLPNSPPLSPSRISAHSPCVSVLSGGIDGLLKSRPQRSTGNAPYRTGRRRVGSRKLESLFERKYLVNKQTLLGDEGGSPTRQIYSSGSPTYVEKACADVSPVDAACAPHLKRSGSESRNHQQRHGEVAYVPTYPSPLQASSPLTEKTNCSSYVDLRRSHLNSLAGPNSKLLSKNLCNTVHTAVPEHEQNADLLAKNSDDQPAYACMERAVDLFLDHNKLLEDIRRVQLLGIRGPATEECKSAMQVNRIPGEPEAPAIEEGLTTLRPAVCSPETFKDSRERWSSSGWASATMPSSRMLASLTEVDAYTVGALNSVSSTRVSGTKGGHYVVLSALEWERFKRIVCNLISANLVLQAKVRHTQRHFRSLGYLGDLEQTLAKLKSEELRIRRELALRESQFADTFTLSARLAQHKAALMRAERQVDHLKDEAQKIKDLKEMLQQAKESIQLQGSDRQTSGVPAPTKSPRGIPPKQLLFGEQEPPQLTSGDTPHNGVDTPYVEFHRCVRIAANKCFIVRLFAPTDALKRGGYEAVGKAVSALRDWQTFPVPGHDSTKHNVEASPICAEAGHDACSSNLQQVGQAFLRQQMDEAIHRSSREILLVVYNAETSDANIQPLTIANSEGSTLFPRQANLNVVAEVICRNLRLTTLPFNMDSKHTKFGQLACAEVAHHTLEYGRSLAVERHIRQRKEKHRVLVSEEFDETNIHDAGADLLYVGCHEISGCSGRGPRHYLVRIYKCRPRYLVARVFSPRSLFFHSCWIDACWAMQIYEASENLAFLAPPPPTSRSRSPVPSSGSSTPRDGCSTPQYGVTSPLRAPETPRGNSSAGSDVEKIASRRKVVLRSGRELTGGIFSSLTAFNPSFLRFVAMSLRFDKDRLCVTPTEACSTGERKPISFMKKNNRSLTHTPSSKKKYGQDRHSNNTEEDEYELVSSGASQLSAQSEIESRTPRKLYTFKERQQAAPQAQSRPPAAPRACSQALKITHAQVVQRSRKGDPKSFTPCFVLVRSCVVLAAATVTVVVYEPSSSWCAESSFSLIEALTLIYKRTRTFVQKLRVGTFLLEEVLSELKSNSNAMSHSTSRSHRHENAVEEKHIDERGRLTPTSPSRHENDQTFAADIRATSWQTGLSGESELIRAAGNSLTELEHFVGELAVSAKPQVVCLGIIPPEDRGEGLDKIRHVGQAAPPEVRVGDEEEGRFETNGSPASGGESGLHECAAMETLPPFGHCEGADLQAGVTTNIAAPATRYGSSDADSRCVKSLPASTDVKTAKLADPQDPKSPRNVLPSENLICSEGRQKQTLGASHEFSPAPAFAVADDLRGGGPSEEAHIPNLDVAQPHAGAFDTSPSLAASGEGKLQDLGNGGVRELLSEDQWKSLLREIFVGLEVRGDRIIVPGLSMVPVSGL